MLWFAPLVGRGRHEDPFRVEVADYVAYDLRTDLLRPGWCVAACEERPPRSVELRPGDLELLVRRGFMPIEGAAVLTEDFDTADSATVGHNQTWANIVHNFHNKSNRCQNNTSTVDIARVETDVGSADNYAQATCVIVVSNAGNFWSVICRMDTDATHGNGYMYEVRQTSNGTSGVYKMVAYDQSTGSSTLLGTVTALNLVTNDVIRIEACGSGITARHNGVEVRRVVDTTYTTQQRCGVFGLSAVIDRVGIDNFECGPSLIASRSMAMA